MKLIALLSILLFDLGGDPQINIPFERNAAVEFVEGDQYTITVNADGYGDNIEIATWYAERNALENILFRGIPDSNQKNPMIEDESQSYTKSKNALENLIFKGFYKKFVIESYMLSRTKAGKGTCVRQVVKFDLNALRKYLEQENVVRKFGF